MKKLAIPALVLLAVVALASWLGLSVLGGNKGLRAQVPADTAFYFGGTPDARILAQKANYPAPRVPIRPLVELISSLNEHSEMPGAALLRALLLDYSARVATQGDLFSHYGIDPEGEEAFYLHGLMPVARLPIADEDALDEVLQWVSEQAGVAPVEEQIEDLSLRRWRLTPADAPRTLDFVVALQDGVATFTLLSSLDTEEERLERIGLRAPQTSLADSGEFRQLVEQRGFNQNLAGFLHIQRIAAGLLEADDSRLARDFSRLLTLSGEENPFAAELSEACRQEVAQLFGAAPRALFGYRAVAAEGDQVKAEMDSLLEVNASGVMEPLQALRGHLPGHLQGNQMLGLGLGIDMDALAPTLTRLWQAGQEARFQCPQLQQLQRQMATTSPAALGLITGMVQGIKGVGLSIHELSFDESTGLPENIDLLFSLATENPQLLISLFNSSVTSGSGGRIPEIPLDGSPTRVDLGFLLPGLEATIGLQGQHLVLYVGDQSAQAAAALAEEPLDKNGLSSFYIDGGRLGRWLEALPAPLLSQLSGTGENICLLKAQAHRMLGAQPITLYRVTDLEEAGIATHSSMALLPTPAGAGQVGPLPGRYELLDLNQNCGQPPMIGEEQINADGTGHYVEFDPTGQCETLRYHYRWTRYGSLLLFDVDEGQMRDSCVADWEPLSAHQMSCELVPANGGFDCIYPVEQDANIFRYRRLP